MLCDTQHAKDWIRSRRLLFPLMIVLGIETSCDETAAALVEGGSRVLSSVVRDQIAQHRPYGGVVPEVASRNHVVALPEVIESALKQAGLQWKDVGAVAATYGPGLASSLLVGLSAGKALALSLGVPFIGIDHIEAHMYSVFLDMAADSRAAICPFVALAVSGGHTCLVRVERLGHYRLLGQTVDDAAGEAFDKGANLLGLSYPGGPAIDKAARTGDPAFVKFPRGRQKKETEKIKGLNPELCFSFSGLKTALLYYLKRRPLSGDSQELASLAASYQAAIVDALITRCEKAITDETHIAAVGGVSLNSSLRAGLTEMARNRHIELLLAQPRFCADNAAMVAGLAGAGGGISGPPALELDATPGLRLAEPTEGCDSGN